MCILGPWTGGEHGRRSCAVGPQVLASASASSLPRRRPGDGSDLARGRVGQRHRAAHALATLESLPDPGAQPRQVGPAQGLPQRGLASAVVPACHDRPNSLLTACYSSDMGDFQTAALQTDRLGDEEDRRCVRAVAAGDEAALAVLRSRHAVGAVGVVGQVEVDGHQPVAGGARSRYRPAGYVSSPPVASRNGRNRPASSGPCSRVSATRCPAISSATRPALR